VGRERRGRRSAEDILGAELGRTAEDWYADNVRGVATFFRRAFQLLSYNGVQGDYAEFGCMSGTTFSLAWHAASLTGHAAHLWAFDSFAGLPSIGDARDVHPQWVEGGMAMSEADFHAACARRGVPRDRYTTVAGYYADTLAPGAGGPRPERVALAYVDCDLYTSTVDALTFLLPRIGNGTVVAFADYYCPGPEGASGERLASVAVFAAHPDWRLVPYHPYGWHGMSFVIERRTTAGLTGEPLAH
jgi:hypothetical protein